MAKKVKPNLKVYDPRTGKIQSLERLIERLGILAVAQKYHVSESAVRKWRLGIHEPARRTITKSMKELF